MPNENFPVRVIRSARRTKTISARLVGGVVEVRVPAFLSEEETRRSVKSLVKKIQARRAAPSNTELMARAQLLNEKFLEGKASVASIRWVGNQQRRWGSCTPATGEIRISNRLQKVPGYVLDAVIIHELVHTFILGGHTVQFWAWADRAPKAERAKGYLEALSDQAAEGDGEQLVD